MELHGRLVKRRGVRHFAISKPLGLADRIAAASNTRPNSWDRVMSQPRCATVMTNFRKR